MSLKTRRALDALMDLTPHERGLVLCWFCDACYVHVGPGENHRCKAGSSVYPREKLPDESEKGRHED